MSNVYKSSSLPDAKAQDWIDSRLYVKSSPSTAYSPDELDVCHKPAHELYQMVADKKMTLPEAVKRFHYQKQLLGNKHMALTDVLYDQPLAFAQDLQNEVDEQGASTVASKRPLLGFIISIKDSVIYKGTYSTHGFKRSFIEPFQWTAGMITHLESLGAVITCKGNVPQALMACESDNNLFGNVSNPHGPTRTAGGSSGGEAALIASFQVNAAVGSDVAGSLRIPALFCGIVSLKPTAGRLAEVESNYAQQWKDFEGQGDYQTLILPTCGPMARTVRDVEALMKAMNSYNEVHLSLPPLPWKQVTLPTKIGVIRGFPTLLEPCAAATRALNQAVAATGMKVVEIDLSDLIEEVVVNAMCCFFKDVQLIDAVKGRGKVNEPLVDAFKEFKTLVSVPPFLLRSKLIHKLLKLSFRELFYVKAYLMSRETNNSALEITQEKLKNKVMAKIKAAGVEVFLTPGLFPAITKHTANATDFMCLYCFIWNYLNFPAGAVPMTRVRASEQEYRSEKPDKISQAIGDNMKGTEGLPMGVQVVGFPWREEMVIEVMKVVEAGADKKLSWEGK